MCYSLCVLFVRHLDFCFGCVHSFVQDGATNQTMQLATTFLLCSAVLFFGVIFVVVALNYRMFFKKIGRVHGMYLCVC
jgi:hypothetical protein